MGWGGGYDSEEICIIVCALISPKHHVKHNYEH